MSLKDFLKDRELPEKAGEIKAFHRKESKKLSGYISINRLDAKEAKALTKQLAEQHEADLREPGEEFDVATLKEFNCCDPRDEQLQEFLKKSEELNKQTEDYRQNEMKTDKEAETAQINELLSKNGRRRINVPADGSCLFSSVGLHFPGANLRQEMLQYIQEDAEMQQTIKDFTGEDVQAYLQRMEEDWGDEIEVLALSKALHRQITVWSRHGRTDYGEGLPPIEILHMENGPGGLAHYNGVELPE